MLIGSSCMKMYEDLLRSYIYIHTIEGPSLTIFWHFLRCPGMRFRYEVLMSRHSVASCAKASSCSCSYEVPTLIPCCSIATVSCIWYIYFPPRLFGGILFKIVTGTFSGTFESFNNCFWFIFSIETWPLRFEASMMDPQSGWPRRLTGDLNLTVKPWIVWGFFKI